MTREEWLNAAVALIRPYLKEMAQVVVPDTFRVSVGFAGGRGKKGDTIGQCWYPEASEDKSTEMFISPVLGDPSRVLDVLVHEMIHAGGNRGHRGGFRKAAIAAGLEGKMTATVAGERLKGIIAGWIEKLGKFPHAALNTSTSRVGGRQTTRMLKVICPSCAYTVRTTAKWIEIGTPTCVCGEQMEAV